jgi:hypothetical protein
VKRIEAFPQREQQIILEDILTAIQSRLYVFEHILALKNMENYERLVEGIEREATLLRAQIENIKNPFKKQRLLNNYVKLVNFLR